MFLQVYFFIVTIYGWYNWKTNKSDKMISEINFRKILLLAAAIFIFSLLSGYLFSNIHLYLPEYFKAKAAYPYIDSLVMVSSIMATVLLAKKKIENWYLWIAVDLVCVVLYFKKGIYFLSFEYFIFLGLASYGLFNWKKQLSYD
jgi:nicotinamide mononucleotide transporter